MSWKEYESDCPGCRPALIDAQTGKLMERDSDPMRAINAVFDSATLQEKKAFHNVMCNNSREPMEMALVHGLTARFEEACKRN